MSKFDEDMAMLCGTKPEGYGAIWRIVRAHEAGESLRADDVALLMKGLRAFTIKGEADDHLQEFARLAKLRLRQGRHGPTYGEAKGRIWLVVEVLIRQRELEAGGMEARQARATATTEVAMKRHRAKRTVQKNVEEFGDSARQEIATMDAAQKMVDDITRPARQAVAQLKAMGKLAAAARKKRADNSKK